MKKNSKGGRLTETSRFIHRYIWRSSWWWRSLTILVVALILFTTAMYGVGQWYIRKHSKEPLNLGTTFISDYAQELGVDPKQTLNSILGDLGIKRVRLVSYWNKIEPAPGNYDFSDLDWQFAMANKYHAKVSLAIGMRQPRWPECHEPSWVEVGKGDWQNQLYSYMTAVINRYKNNPALSEYQLENEFFMKVFGECKDFSRQRLVNEFTLVKKLDKNHKIIISRSDNWIGVPIGAPTPDQFGISVYKRVWDATITHRYFEYPLPAWFYSALAGTEEIISGRDMIIHELQAEPWAPNQKTIQQTPLQEQYKSMNAKRMRDRISYGQSTGMRTVDLWGAEWWYWLKQTQHDPSVWNTVKTAVAQANDTNANLQKQ